MMYRIIHVVILYCSCSVSLVAVNQIYVDRLDAVKAKDNPLEEMPMDAKHKHLEFIQGVVNRLAANSFQLKGWSLVLVSAIFFLLGRGGPSELVAIAFIPVLFFWGLDGYFLRQERLFRDLYNHVRVLKDDAIDFSMETSSFEKNRTWKGAVISRTLCPFYGALALTILLAMFVVKEISPQCL